MSQYNIPQTTQPTSTPAIIRQISFLNFFSRGHHSELLLDYLDTTSILKLKLAIIHYIHLHPHLHSIFSHLPVALAIDYMIPKEIDYYSSLGYEP